MEQNNLVVTADGKTWDEVTRDTSYIGNMCVTADTDTNHNWSTYVIFDDWRGTDSTSKEALFNKDFAIAYDRVICLVDGQYNITAFNGYSYVTGANLQVKINGNTVNAIYSTSIHVPFHCSIDANLKRGDYIQVQGEYGTDNNGYHEFQIRRI